MEIARMTTAFGDGWALQRINIGPRKKKLNMV